MLGTERSVVMSLVVTMLVGLLGGAFAFYLELPLPWLLGSLLAAVIVTKKIPKVKAPPKKFSRAMRILLGVALGGSVAESIVSIDSSITVSLVSAIAFVVLILLFGSYYFRRLANFSALDAFMSALPGGLTFLVSMAGDLGNRFPKIALIHTVRMVTLIFVFSLFAYFLGVKEGVTHATLESAFNVPLDKDLWQVLLLVLISGLVANKIKVAGGDIMFPMIIAAFVYGNGWIEVPMPELIITLSMITFGAVIGCKIAAGSAKESGQQIRASLIFTIVSLSLALVIAIGLGEAFDKSYFLFFLALAPGSIPEMCLIAMAMGLDVGFVALIHTCRYLFVMFIGALGFNILSANEKGKLVGGSTGVSASI